MKKANLILTFALILVTTAAICQQHEKRARYFDGPILTDSSAVFLPVRYDGELFANKMAVWGYYYSNILVYDLKTDSHRKLFEKDTYIEGFEHRNDVRYRADEDLKYKHITEKWVFMKVKTEDTNRNGKVDEHDPTVLFVTTTKGEDLRQLTDETENVLSLDIYEAQGFAMLKIQRDTNKDKSFRDFERDYYYRKIDLNDLNLGKPIEIR